MKYVLSTLDIIMHEKVVGKISDIEERYEQSLKEYEWLTKEKKSKMPKKNMTG